MPAYIYLYADGICALINTSYDSVPAAYFDRYWIDQFYLEDFPTKYIKADTMSSSLPFTSSQSVRGADESWSPPSIKMQACKLLLRIFWYSTPNFRIDASRPRSYNRNGL